MSKRGRKVGRSRMVYLVAGECQCFLSGERG